MDDAISRSAVHIVINSQIFDTEYPSELDELERSINEIPALDAVPVVRCKDCKWRFSSNCPMFHEELTYNEDDGYEWIDRDHTSDDGFCEQGERRDGEAE